MIENFKSGKIYWPIKDLLKLQLLLLSTALKAHLCFRQKWLRIVKENILVKYPQRKSKWEPIFDRSDMVEQKPCDRNTWKSRSDKPTSAERNLSGFKLYKWLSKKEMRKFNEYFEEEKKSFDKSWPNWCRVEERSSDRKSCGGDQDPLGAQR